MMNQFMQEDGAIERIVMNIEGFVDENALIRMTEGLDAARPAVTQAALNFGFRKAMQRRQFGGNRAGGNEPDGHKQFIHQGNHSGLIHGKSFSGATRAPKSSGAKRAPKSMAPYTEPSTVASGTPGVHIYAMGAVHLLQITVLNLIGLALGRIPAVALGRHILKPATNLL